MIWSKFWMPIGYFITKHVFNYTDKSKYKERHPKTGCLIFVCFQRKITADSCRNFYFQG